MNTFPCYPWAAESVQLAAINCTMAHLVAVMHPSIILMLPAASWFHLRPLLVCVCEPSVWAPPVCRINASSEPCPGSTASLHQTSRTVRSKRQSVALNPCSAIWMRKGKQLNWDIIISGVYLRETKRTVIVSLSAATLRECKITQWGRL